MNKEQYITEIMNSLSGIQKVEGNPFLHTKVLARLEQQKQTARLSLKLIYIFATCIAVLLSVNIFLWNEFTQEPIASSIVSTAANEYDLTTLDY